MDESGDIVSAIAVERINARSSIEVPFYFINAMAVALRVRGQGGGIADAALNDALVQVAHRVRAAGGDQFTVAGRIHRKNSASQSMAARNGMEPIDGEDDGEDDGENEDPYLLWSMPVDIN